MSEGFCTDCGVPVESFEGLSECPNCGSKGMPCSFSNQVEVSINWHELQLLCIWAERWGHAKCGGAGTVYSIAQRLMDQHPDRSPLTLARQVQDLKDLHGGDVDTNVPGVE